MISRGVKERILEYLKLHIDPVFVYFLDSPGDGVFEILYLSTQKLDDYRICEIELALNEIAEATVALIDINDCDILSASEYISYGELVYCKDEKQREDHMHAMAMEFEQMYINRNLLLDRLRNSGTFYVQ